MAKLSDITKAKELLAKLDTKGLRIRHQSLTSELTKIFDIIKHTPANMNKVDDSLIDSINQLDTLLMDLGEKVDKELSDWTSTAKMHSKSWTSDINKLSWTEFCDWKKQFYPLNPNLEDHVKLRLDQISDWSGPAMIYHLDDVKRISSLLSHYPIYVVDKFKEANEDIVFEFTVQQSRKIRFYDLDHSHELPKASMRVILSINHFTHTDEDKMIAELESLLNFLIPGGIIAFNFNDCQSSELAKLFEAGMRSYSRSSRIMSFINDKNLILRHKKTIPYSSSYFEIKKPGSFSSIKKHEPLGVINYNLDFMKRLNELREQYIGLSEQQLTDIIKRERGTYRY